MIYMEKFENDLFVIPAYRHFHTPTSFPRRRESRERTCQALRLAPRLRGGDGDDVGMTN